MEDYLRTAAAIAYKDLVVELRTRETLVAGSVLALLIVAIFAFALELAPATARDVAPGLLWTTLAFAGVLTFGRLFGPERDRGSLDGLLLAPADPSALYVGKMASALLFMLLVLVVTLPALAALTGAPLLTAAVVPVALLGLLGLAAAGTLFAALALSGRARDVLLPILFLPLSIPVVLTATGATRLIAQGQPSGPALGVLAACDALYIAASTLLFPYIVEE